MRPLRPLLVVIKWFKRDSDVYSITKLSFGLSEFKPLLKALAIIIIITQLVISNISQRILNFESNAGFEWFLDVNPNRKSLNNFYCFSPENINR